MKHLQTYKNYKINESIVKPFDFSELIGQLKETSFSSLEEINKISEKYGIIFSDFDTFYNTLARESEKKVAPKDLMLFGGVKFALFNKYIDKINIVVESEIFFEYLHNDEDKTDFYNFIHQVLRHESIHKQQVSKMGKDIYRLDASPTGNQKSYWSNPQEIMAYAHSLVNDLMDQGHNKEEITDILKHEKNIKSWIHQVHKKYLDPNKYKKFMKYAYEYIDTL